MFLERLPAWFKGLVRILGWRRLLVALAASMVFGRLLGLAWRGGLTGLMVRAGLLGLFAVLAFGILEQWPARLPSWLPRWALQVGGVALVIPLSTISIYLVTTPASAPPFWQNQDRFEGWIGLTVLALLVAPWMTVIALLRQVTGEARNRELAFELERSELERQALDARLHLLQAQVEPHFLFNTLANVRELVDTGSPRASNLLGSLIAYLRAAVPRLHDPTATLGQELDLVRAYLEVMHMRIPDRLAFDFQVNAGALSVPCPPMALLTLVENAVHHGIDPSETGGRIEIRVTIEDGRCHAVVVDTGVGLDTAKGEKGMGLSNLQERLRLTFGPGAQVNLHPHSPKGVRAELIYPIPMGAA